MMMPATTLNPHRLSLAQLQFVARAVGVALPATLRALVDAASQYDGDTAETWLADLIDRGVVCCSETGTMTVTEPVAASLRLLGSAEVAVEVRGRLADRAILCCLARRGGEAASVLLAEDDEVELRRLPAAELTAELGWMIPDQPAGTGRRGILRIQVRCCSGAATRLGQVTWVADDTGWRALLPAQNADGQPDVHMVPRTPTDLAIDLAPLLADPPT